MEDDLLANHKIFKTFKLFNFTFMQNLERQKKLILFLIVKLCQYNYFPLALTNTIFIIYFFKITFEENSNHVYFMNEKLNSPILKSI